MLGGDNKACRTYFKGAVLINQIEPVWAVASIAVLLRLLLIVVMQLSPKTSQV